MFFHILFLLFSHLKLFPLFKSATLGEAQQTVSSKDTLKKKHPLKLNFPLLYSLHAKEFRREECPLEIGFLKKHTTMPNFNQDVLLKKAGEISFDKKYFAIIHTQEAKESFASPN